MIAAWVALAVSLLALAVSILDNRICRRALREAERALATREYGSPLGTSAPVVGHRAYATEQERLLDNPRYTDVGVRVRSADSFVSTHAERVERAMRRG